MTRVLLAGVFVVAACGVDAVVVDDPPVGSPPAGVVSAELVITNPCAAAAYDVWVMAVLSAEAIAEGYWPAGWRIRAYRPGETAVAKIDCKAGEPLRLRSELGDGSAFECVAKPGPLTLALRCD